MLDGVVSIRRNNMLIKNTSISIKYKKIDNLKKNYFINEDILKEHFNEATVLPIPDEAPLEIPRIIIKSKNEHSQLNISPIAATLQIDYNDGYEKDWNKCEDYIINKMKIVFSFFNILTKNEYEYIGVVSEILLDEYLRDGAKILAHNLLKNSGESSIYDLNIRYTFVKEDKIFVNIMLQNARLFKDGIDTNCAGELSIDNQVSESIGAVIDINDRYGYNTCKDYKTDSSKLDCIIDEMTEVIDGKLNELIEKGVY
jgi:predicted small secreted protein